MSTRSAPNPVREMSQEGFRQKLAGLCSTASSGSNAEYRDQAVRIAVVLARHFNRDVLKPTTLWDRIETALRSGSAKGGSDPSLMISSMLEHVKADCAGVGRDPEVRTLIAELIDRDRAYLDGLRRYIRSAVFAVVAFGRQQWEAEKQQRAGRMTVADEAAAREDGRPASKWFDEADVQAEIKRRATLREEGGAQ